ncbi:MAG: glycoside hydrolase family 32 protein, partial [Muribaculaceae bacterium]|nr:glycoside hydrolase family 32 protein [Muribaculaceae bacterium]
TPEYARCNKGQWECPDLICLDYKGGKKWVMIVSTNPGGPAGGSGIFYFPGDFDGTTFTADAREDYPLWLDSGADNYAGVTWHNAPDGRHVLIGWMNNWNYAGVCPVSPWRSAMTLPRELKLTDFGGKPYLTANVVDEIEGIASEWRDADGNLGVKHAYQLQVEADMDKTTTLTLSNAAGERLDIIVNGPARHMAVKRNGKTGDVSFNSSFSLPSIGCDLMVTAPKLC